MGVMRFLVPRRDLVAPDAAERAYMAGLDEIPWHARFQWTADGLSVERAESDSGNVFLPCPVDGHGELLLSTASLMERPQPYHLHVELARGTLNRLRNQIAGWEAFGVRVPHEVRALVHASAEQLAHAVTRQHEPEAAAMPAVAATDAALRAMDLLSQAYVEQVLAARHEHAGKINALVGINLGQARPTPPVAAAITRAFNTAVVPMTWRQIEAHEGKRDWALCDAQIDWCRAAGLKVSSGPLLELDKWSLPDWMFLWGADESENFRSCVAEHVDAVVRRYRGRVNLWQCAARLNINNEFEQGEEERLRLAVLVVETIRQVDPRTPIVIALDQPWGTYMGRDDYDLSPLNFADALVRAELGLAGIALEMNLGYAPHGSEPRDVLEFGRQIDRFSTLGLPLLVSLTVASSDAADPKARLSDKVIGYAPAGQPSPAAQRAWAEKYVPLLLARQPVQGVLWNQLLDSQPHPFPHGGLFDARDEPKPILAALESLRQQHVV